MTGEDRLLESARTAAYRLLARRSRSVSELLFRLKEKGFPEAVVTPLIERLKELKYLDDYAVARQWTRSYAVNKLWGDLKIRSRLLDLGIPAEIIPGALGEVRKDFTERAAIIRIMEKRFPDRLTGSAISVNEERRLVRQLAAKGFSLPTIFEVLANPVKEEDCVDGQ